MKRSRVAAVVLCLALILCMLAGCRKAPPAQEKKGLNIYASFYPIYALAQMIAADVPDLQLHCLVQPQDGCLRDYRLSDWDAALLSSADAVLLGGRGLESFETAVFSLGEDGPAVSALLYNMDLSSYEPAEMREESHWLGENPHIYLKTEGAQLLAERIAATMIALDPDYSEIYEKNLEYTKNRLKSIKEEMQTLVGDVSGISAAVLNEALVYTAEEFGLEISLCVDRDSGENVDAEGLTALVDQLSRSGARLVLLEKQAPKALSAALEDAGYAVARMDVLSTHSESEGAEGYFDALKANAAALKTALEAAGKENI